MNLRYKKSAPNGAKVVLRRTIYTLRVIYALRAMYYINLPYIVQRTYIYLHP